MKNRLCHESIRAFAGSGKTHALVNRYIRLLALGVKAARINALTFTRKAAGEFLQKIFLRLTEAASDEDKAARLSGEIGQPDLRAKDYQELLAKLVASIGELQLATIDSFFARLISAFPYELGLTRPHRIMDEYEHSVARMAAMERLLATGDESREFRILQLYKNLTWGAEEKNVYRLFEKKLKDHQALFLESGDPRQWGQVEAIYRDRPWWVNTVKEPSGIVQAIREELASCEFPKRLMGGMLKLVDEFANYQPGAGLKKGALLSQFLDVREALKNGTASITYYRQEVEIPVSLGKAIFEFLQYYVSKEIARRIVITQSLGDLLDAFDREYSRSVRELGSLVFADLPMLLIKGLCHEKPAFSAAEMVYRMDGQTDHWLVDEFQDTSRIQWKVLSFFIDEIIQDPGGDRSFFYVGDVKQSIYAWRGGDPRLFNEILEHYNIGEAQIQSIPLEYSWRSSPPVLDCVNQLFGDGICPPLVSMDVARRWENDWLIHKPSPATEGKAGYAAWGLVDDEENLHPACASLIHSVDPLGNGLSCAVLVRKNTEVLAVTQALREAGIPASMEGVVQISRDNVVGRWVMAFLYSLARPDEKFPRAYLGLPGIELGEEEYRKLAGLIRLVLTNNGYAEAVRRLITFLKTQFEFDAFLGRRSEQILEAATRFEGTAMDNLEQFIAYLDESQVAESSLKSQVQVMTVHKSKGLDFDMVIVAGFGADPIIGGGRQSLHVERTPEGEIEWILELPVKDVYQHDPVLDQANRSHEETSCFEALCLLYVAMTRAKSSLYCLSAQPSGNRTLTTWHDLFSSAFSGQSEPRQDNSIEWQAEWGNPEWVSQTGPLPPVSCPGVQLDAIRGPMPDIRPALALMASPSQESHAEQGQAVMLRSRSGREFGTRMHDFLALVEWVDTDRIDNILTSADTDLQERAKALFKSDLGREVFSKPAGPFQLWREKPYVLRQENKVAHGIIDRAIVHLDESGQPVNMTIYDFKTDTLDPDRPAEEQLLERYQLQLQRYREAAVALTGLRENDIRTVLVPV